MDKSVGAMKFQRVLVNILKYVLLIFAAFVALVPIVSCVITAFKSVEEYQSTNVMVLPNHVPDRAAPAPHDREHHRVHGHGGTKAPLHDRL